MIISTRNTEILKWLLRYKYLCTAQVHEHFFKGKTLRNTQMTLKKLEKDGLLKVDDLPRSREGINLGGVCYLTHSGYEVAANDINIHDQDVVYSPVTKPISSVNHYYHRKRMVDFMIQLDIELAHKPQLKLKILKTESRQAIIGGRRRVETRIEGGSVSLVPDISFVIAHEQTGNEAAYFVEIDTGKETIGGLFKKAPDGSLIDKYTKYEYFLTSKDWKKHLDTNAQAFEVLTVTETEHHMKSIAARTADRLRSHKLFLFSTYDKLATGLILENRLWWNYSKNYVPLLKRDSNNID